MTMHATIYGRAAFEPRQHTTKAGKDMSTCRLAVDATGHNAEEQQTLWFDLLAFGRQAESLAAVAKGEPVSATGRVTKSVYTTQAGEEREQLTLLADAIVTTRSGRPTGQRPPNGQTEDRPAGYQASMHHQAPTEFDDDMPF